MERHDMRRIEITFASGKFTAIPGVKDDSIRMSEDSSMLTFEAIGTDRTRSNWNVFSINMNHVAMIETIEEAEMYTD